jgi:hypothetical protein
MTLQDRIDTLQQATAGGSALEQLMLHEPVRDVVPNGTQNPGVASATFVVVFESRRQAVLKPFHTQNPRVCAHYGQDPYEAVLHEVVAWRLAWAMGDPWAQLLPTVVLRDIPGGGPGAVMNWRRGGPDQAVFTDAKAQVNAAGFWDALVGQQDRHLTNYRYDTQARRLALIDNAFAFARPGDFINGMPLFLATRRSNQGIPLSPSEKAALDGLLNSDLHGLRDYLATDRADALELRAEQMRSCGMVPLPGAF